MTTIVNTGNTSSVNVVLPSTFSTKLVTSDSNLSIVISAPTQPMVVKVVPARNALAVKLVTGAGGSGGNAGTQGGFIFVTSVTTSGNIGDIVHVPNTTPANVVVSECVVDTDDITIHFIAEGWLTYSPVVTVDHIVCTNLQQYPNDIRTFFGSVTTTLGSSREILIESSTGKLASVIVNKATGGPIIDGVRFIGNYPGTQTEVKAGDYYMVRVDFDPNGPQPSELYIDNYGACQATSLTLTSQILNWPSQHSADIQVTIKSTGNTQQTLPVRCYAKTSLGTSGESVTSLTSSTIIGSSTILCNDVVPSFIDRGTSFPNDQLALKGTESSVQATEVLNYTSVIYSSPNGDFNIASSTTYSINKTITCTNPTHYNDNTINFRIQAYRSANNTSNVFQKVIEVANIAPVITVTQPYSRLRTSAAGASYTITATSTQNMAVSPVLALNVPISGVWQGSTFSGGPKVFTRSITVTDGNPVGSSSWVLTNLPKNKAGILATVIGIQSVGGFVSRTLNLAPFSDTTSLATRVTNINKLQLTWSAKTGMEVATIGTLAPVVKGYTVSALDTNPTDIIILDTAAVAASSQTSYITIEELV